MADAVSLSERRQILLTRPGLGGAEFCGQLSADADRWLAGIADRATGRHRRQVALLAVGGYGRRQLCPYSDLDLVLAYDGRRDMAAVADAIWYPIWDDGVGLDHSVRRRQEVLAAAAGDLRVAMGLLDGRVVWGDAAFGEALLVAVRAEWRATLGASWLPVLAEQMAARWARHGDLAFLLEPDLKESRGGLRDVHAVRALVSAVPSLEGTVAPDRLEDASRVLLSARVELHRQAGRALDRLVLQEQDQAAAALGYADADALMADVAAAGRTIAWACTDALRRAERWRADRRRPDGRRAARPRTGGRRSAAESARPTDPPSATFEPGIVLRSGEVDLDDAWPSDDPTLALRLAAASAERAVPIAHRALDRLSSAPLAPPDPWTPATRAAMVRVLAAGHGAVDALEALDQVGVLATLLPEWALVRNRPQRNAYHRFTVDRHLLETAAVASTLAHRVERPDLLLVGCLLHDIGKGSPGDHTDAGVVLLGTIARRMGFPPDDVATLVSLCRHHLLLPDTATRRDVEDPATVGAVARQVRTRHTLGLLAALTEADGRATGPSAWGPWKAGLVAELVERVDRHLAGAPPPEPPPHPAARHGGLVAAVRSDGRPVVQADPPHLVVSALDRRGLLASVAGVLAVHGLDVRRADASSVEGVAVEEFVIETDRERWPDADRLLRDLDAVLAGRLNVEDRIAERTRAYAGVHRPRTSEPVRPSVLVDLEASVSSTVVDVRARDTIGLLHRLAGALADSGVDVVSARISTIGDTVVDAFYVRDPTGRKVTDPCRIQRIEHSVNAVLD